MLGLDLERAIRDAWLRSRKGILSDPQELHRRLARRRMKILTRPPRAWCIAIRASDRRITPAHWVISPEHAMDLDHPGHPYEPIEHEVTIQTHAIRRYCHPISFSREIASELAKRLGVSNPMLLQARKRGQFEEQFYRGLGGRPGKPVPLLSAWGQLLDPGAARFARPHAIWGGAWEFLAREMPRDFEQTVVRRPIFRRMDGVKVDGYRSQNSEFRIQKVDPLTPALSPAYGGEGGEAGGGGEGASEGAEAETSNVQRSTSNVQSDLLEGEECEGASE